LDLPVSLLTELDAFYLDHRWGGDPRAGVVDRELDTVVWIEFECSARIVRSVCSPAAE